MLFTGKGDDGNTNLFGCCGQRISKSSTVAEALGAVDEINSFLGVTKIAADKKTAQILNQVQQDLFIIQAELAGAKKKIVPKKVTALEKIIAEIEKKLPPIKTFLISGGTALSVQLDYGRAVARRAERRVVQVNQGLALKTNSQGKALASTTILAYLNRLSSLLYALARLENHKSGIKEESPRYQ